MGRALRAEGEGRAAAAGWTDAQEKGVGFRLTFWGIARPSRLSQPRSLNEGGEKQAAYRDAEQTYRTLLGQAGLPAATKAAFLITLADVQGQQPNRVEDARKTLLDALAADPTSVGSRLQLAKNYFAQSVFGEAEKHFLQVVSTIGGANGAPPPPPPREEKGGLLISRGFLGALVLLLLGAAIAGTGFFYYQYAQAQDVVVARDKTIADQKTTLGARDKTIAEQKAALDVRDKAIGDLTLQYGQIEKLKADAAAIHKNAEDVLARRPGTAGIPDRLKQAPWREAAGQTLAKYVADLQKEFTRIDKPVVVAPDTTPDRPRITPSGGSGSPT